MRSRKKSYYFLVDSPLRRLAPPPWPRLSGKKNVKKKIHCHPLSGLSTKKKDFFCGLPTSNIVYSIESSSRCSTIKLDWFVSHLLFVRQRCRNVSLSSKKCPRCIFEKCRKILSRVFAK